MRSAAATVAERGADLIDLNMGCPVPKVCRTGAGAALIKDPDTAVAVARAAVEGSGLPVTVKLRSGQAPGDVDGVPLAHRLVARRRRRARSPSTRARRRSTTRACPTTSSRRGWRPSCRSRSSSPAACATRPRSAGPSRRTGVAAVMLARGALGNPWLFAQTLGLREDEPTRDEVLDELDWVMDRAVEHLGPDRAARYLRKFYPWYLTRMGEGKLAQDALQRTASTGEAKALLAGLRGVPAAA